MATLKVTVAKPCQLPHTHNSTEEQQHPLLCVPMPDGPSAPAASSKAWTSYDGPTQMFIRSPGEIFKHLIDWSQSYSSLLIDLGWGLGLKAV